MTVGGAAPERLEDLGERLGMGAHLTSLVIAMGESAVQGYWAAYEAERGKKALSEQTIQKFINTCHLWREDGPIIKRLREGSASRSPAK